MKKIIVIISMFWFLSGCLNFNPLLTTNNDVIEPPSLNLGQAFSSDLRQVMAVKAGSTTSSSNILALITNSTWTKLTSPNLTYKLKAGDKLKFAIVPPDADLIVNSPVIEIGTYTGTGGADIIGFKSTNSGNAGIELKTDFTAYGVTTVALIAKELKKAKFDHLTTSNNAVSLAKAKDKSNLNTIIGGLAGVLKTAAEKVSKEDITKKAQGAVARASTTNVFWVYYAPNNRNYQRKATLKRTTKNYKIWVDNSTSVSNAFLTAYEKELEDKIYPTLKKNLGEHKDINKDGKAEILISNNIDNRSGGYVAGYVFPGDYYNDKFSNKRDILYMNARMISNNLNGFYSTTAHELQHLHRVKYQYTEAKYNADRAWIDEGTAEYISDEAGYSPQTSRLMCYYNSFCGVNGQSLFDKRAAGVLYAFRYMFMSYLYHVSSGSKEDRQNFVYKTITGYKDEAQKERTTTRANNLEGLLTAFKGSSKYKSSILGSNNEEIFYKLYGSLLFQTNILSYKIVAASGVNEVDFRAKKDSAGTELDFSSIVADYPIPTHLTEIKNTTTGQTTKLRFGAAKATSTLSLNSSRSGEFHFYKGDPISRDKYITFNNTMVLKARDRFGNIITQYNGKATLQYNYSTSSFGDYIKPAITASFNTNGHFLDTSYLNSYEEDTPVCIHEQLSKQFESDMNRNPSLYQVIE